MHCPNDKCNPASVRTLKGPATLMRSSPTGEQFPVATISILHSEKRASHDMGFPCLCAIPACPRQ